LSDASKPSEIVENTAYQDSIKKEQKEQKETQDFHPRDTSTEQKEEGEISKDDLSKGGEIKF
jgi:hypothetical protein